MDRTTARQRILHHATWLASDAPDSLLSTLRPYRGLQRSHFLEVVYALLVLAPELREPALVDRAVVHALWDLCRTARDWTRGPREPMFHGRDFLSPDDQRFLDEWLGLIESASLRLLAGHSVLVAFGGLPWSLKQNNLAPQASLFREFLVELLQAALADENVVTASDEETICEVLGAMGEPARDAVPALILVKTTTKFPAVRAAASSALDNLREK